MTGSAAEIAPISVGVASSCDAEAGCEAISWHEVELDVELLLSVLLVLLT